MRFAFLILLIFVFAAPARADDVMTPMAMANAAMPPANNPDDMVRERQRILKTMAREMKLLSAIAGGDIEGERAALVKSAKEMQELAPLPWRYFGQETAVTQLDTEAKSTIWADPASFRVAQEGFINAANDLALAAPDGKAEDIKAKIKALSATCGACHKQFKN